MESRLSIEDEDHYLRTFEDLLYDSVYLLYLAIDTNQEDYKDDIVSTLIRSSVLNSILLLECASNCVIDVLELPQKFYNDIEKLPFISKYEFFLDKIRSEAKFDRGCKEVQAISELKSIRDLYVHPKVSTRKYQIINEHVRNADYGSTNMLGFPREPKLWTIEHAILSLRSTNDFFNKFFLEWCALSQDQVVDVLLSSNKAVLDQPQGAAIDCVGGLDRAVKEWGIDFEFIGKQI